MGYIHQLSFLLPTVGRAHAWFTTSSEQTIFDSMRPDPAVMAGLDPGIATICTVDQQPPSLNWEDAYASAGLLSALIPSTPFPLDEDQQAS